MQEIVICLRKPRNGVAAEALCELCLRQGKLPCIPAFTTPDKWANQEVLSGSNLAALHVVNAEQEMSITIRCRGAAHGN
jgi:hypothetical protein